MGKGRKLMVRTLSAIVFAALMILSFFFKEAFLPVFAILIVLMSHETFNLLLPEGKLRGERICVTLSAVSLFVLVFLWRMGDVDASFISLSALPVVVAMVMMLFDCSKDYDINAGVFFPLLYVALPVTSANWIVTPGGSFDGLLLLVIFVMIWANDVGAYLIGMGFGQRPDSKKLFPALSPKKSWVGFFGGVLFTLAAAVVTGLFFYEGISLTHWIAMALIISVFGVFGDLFESLVKRHASVKDSGKIMPGHGGALDRFDAALLSIPLVAMYVYFFSLI